MPSQSSPRAADAASQGGAGAPAAPPASPDATVTATATATAPWGGLGAVQRWTLLAMLALASVLSFLDRNLLKLLVEPLKQDLGVSDLQISLLVGVSFSLLYSVSCVPMGFLSDVVNRKRLLGAAVLVWSGMAAACGMATSYWQLFAGRAGLGIGEAALQPTAMSLIQDSFPPQARARAFSIFGVGPLLGSGLAMLVGGLLYAYAAAGGTQGWPLLGHLRAWQFALVVPALAGAVLGAGLLLLREPVRMSGGGRGGRAGFGELFAHMGRQRCDYLLLFAAPTLWSLASSGWTGWMAAAIGRTWHLAPGQIGAVAGPIALVCTPLGLVGAGVLIDALSARGRRDASLQVTLVIQALHMLPAMLMFFMPSVGAMWGCYAASMLLTGTVQVMANTLLAEATPGRLIGKAGAVFNMVQNFLGLAIGPTVFALVARGLFGGDAGLLQAMLLCYPLFIALSMGLVLALLLRRRRMRAG